MRSEAKTADPDTSERIRSTLSKSTYFRGLPSATLDKLAAIGRLESHSPAARLHAPGAAAAWLWLVVEGSIRVVKPLPNAEVRAVAVLGVGSFYTVGAFVENASMHFEAFAETAAVAAIFSSRELRRLARDDQALGSLVPKLLLGRLEALASLFLEAVAVPLPQRIARRLLAQALSAPDFDTAAPIDIAISQHSLAAIVGASRSRLNVELRHLQSAGVLSLRYRHVLVRDLPRLWEMAGPDVLSL